MSTFLSITAEENTFDREQNSKWFAVKCIATIGSPNEGELLNMQRLINGERNWEQEDDNYNTLFSSKFVCVRKEGQGIDFSIYPTFWVHTRTQIHNTNVYDYYFTLFFDWSAYSIAYIDAQTNNNITTSLVGFYTQNHTTYYSALSLYSYGTYHYILSLLTYDSNKWGLSINANMPLSFDVEPNNVITANYDIIVRYQDHNYLYVAFNTANNWFFYIGGLLGVISQARYDILLYCVIVDSVTTEEGDARTTTINVKLTGDRDTIVDILNIEYPQGFRLWSNHLMLNVAGIQLTDYVINDSTPIITLPTTTQYNKGDVTLSTNVAIVDSNTTEQNKIEYNTASIVYTLTDATDESVIYTGVGTWSSKTATTDPEQGAMQNNTINVLFSNIPIGEYIYKVVYTYSDGNTYMAEMTINVIALTLNYFGVIYAQMGFVLNRPISLQFSVTTGTAQGEKPFFLKINCTCLETNKTMARYLYVQSYQARPFIDFRTILPNYYNANKKTYTIRIESILINNKWQEYDTAVDFVNLTINDATDRVAWSVWLYNGECNQITTCILPQFLTPIQGFSTKMYITFFANNQRLFKNTTLIYTTSANNWGVGYWNTEIFDFTDITTEDVLIVRGLWTLNDTIKPIIASTEERVMVKFIAPDDVEMPTFAMLLGSIYSEPILVDANVTAQKVYPNINGMYNVVEKISLYIPMLTNKSIYYYNELFANQNDIMLSNGGEWCKYKLTNINAQNATDGYDNGTFTISLQKELTTKKYIQL